MIAIAALSMIAGIVLSIGYICKAIKNHIEYVANKKKWDYLEKLTPYDKKKWDYLNKLNPYELMEYEQEKAYLKERQAYLKKLEEEEKAYLKKLEEEEKAYLKKLEEDISKRQTYSEIDILDAREEYFQAKIEQLEQRIKTLENK